MSTNRNIYRRSIAPHISRVMADGGIPTDNVNAAIELMRFYEEQKDSIKLFYFPALTGNKIRTSGLNKFVSKGYSMNNPQQESLANDAVQTTSTSQPYLSGNIAPNEKYGLKNPNGGSNFMTHPTISFAANESWSVTTVLNRFGSSLADTIYGNSSSYTGLYAEANKFVFYYNTSVSVIFSELISKYTGKNIHITFVYNGTALSMYINGVFMESKTITFSFIVKDLLLAHAQSIYTLKGKIHAHIIRSQALTQQQVTSEYNLLRSYIPEIESVQIGTQTWATSNCEMAATPMGNVIAEMQANSNVEKIAVAADRDFSSDTGFWNKAGCTINSGGNGVCDFSSAPTGSNISKSSILIIGKWYKIQFTILNYSSGSARFSFAGGLNGQLVSANGTYTQYMYCSAGASVYFECNGTSTFQLDNISVQEVGWSGSQELYDYIYAQTAGTVEQKTYAACKAAAMWCHYNNDVSIGAIYGKLYNWFAALLLKMDIDYYNANNPTTPWGWRVPTQADFQTLSTYLGGDSVSGGKLKKEGTTYWNTTNAGANNSSGFSSVGSGNRDITGSFANINTYNYIWGLEVYRLRIDNNAVSSSIGQSITNNGFSLRLIKT